MGVVRSWISASSPVLVLYGLGCGGGHEASAPQVVPNDPAAVSRGSAAFVGACASCHASRDAYDLAYFGFPDSVIVRRGSRHVSPATAADIAAYVRSLGVSPEGRSYRLFQPAGEVAVTDGDFWTRLVGAPAGSWPATLTAERIRAIDLRAVVAPLGQLYWSSETNDDDWMPDSALAPAILDAGGGSVRRLRDAYYASPSQSSLLALVSAFRSVVRDTSAGAQPLCYGETGTQPYADQCFDAMRWMSSLAAMHLVRRGITEAIPIDIVRLWWETGEAAVSTNFVPRSRPASAVRKYRTAAWLYLAFSYAPGEFREENAYLGQFLQSIGLSHLAMFAALRRMVGDGRVHVPSATEPEWDGQRAWDGALAVIRAPPTLTIPAALFVLDYLISRLQSGETYRPQAKSIVDGALQLLDQAVATAPATPALSAQVAARRTTLNTLLATAFH